MSTDSDRTGTQALSGRSLDDFTHSTGKRG